MSGWDDTGDLSLAWDAAERYGVALLREALPQALTEPVPAGELAVAAARFRSAVRKGPYRQLARAAWGQRPSKRSPAGDLVRYARQYPETTSQADPGAHDTTYDRDHDHDAANDHDAAYDPFAGGAADDESLHRGFEVALLSWEAIGAVSEQRWLTRLGWWGLPRALARAWHGDFDRTTWTDPAEIAGTHGSWPGHAPSLAELGIREPPVGT